MTNIPDKQSNPFRNTAHKLSGEIKIEKIGIFRSKQTRFTLQNSEKQIVGIHSIRAKRLEKDEMKGSLTRWQSRSWVRINVLENGVDSAILLNICSIVDRTGLTKKQIKDAAKKANAEATSTKEIVEDQFKIAPKVRTFDDFLQESVVNLAEGIKSELSTVSGVCCKTCGRNTFRAFYYNTKC
ncbi:MAG: hypothetical protein H0X29_02790 [Parachlamydiaceae bacterium]|nr:hypothetical protein [Parachlamydiaceae bacterium]